MENENAIQKKFTEQQKELFAGLEKFARERQILINQTRTGFQMVPVIEDKPVSSENFRKLPEAQQEAFQKSMEAVQEQIDAVVREVNKIGMNMGAEVESYMEKVTLYVVKGRLDIIKHTYREWPDMISYLDAVQEDIVENVESFLRDKKGNQGQDPMMFVGVKPFFQRYQVNVLVDRKNTRGAPVIFESNPTYHNVFGQIEKRTQMGTITTDFSMVQAGSLLRANGGYLIMEVESVLLNPYVWEALKRALQNKLLHIEDVAVGLGYGTASLRPEPIPLEVKVILYGGYFPFQILQDNDAKFNKLFKVRADFDDEVRKNQETIDQYVQFIAKACSQEDMRPLTPAGVSAIIEFGGRYVDRKDKLSIRFGPIMSLLKEANYWAEKEDADQVTDQHVEKAFNESRFRYNLYEEKIHENYAENTVIIDVEGAVIGQVNALAVYQVGDISFGRPSRITAETYMGKSGIINVEREAKLSGNTHDKGVLIISGYLGRTFAQQHSLGLSISIAFEQNYSGIDGDSASSTELYAILSSLSGLPIQQSFAVTGSVNQKGEVQAIGGVNEKIEGFYEVCKVKGLNGMQGVLIPKANVKNLMLKKEVIDAVTDGNFHIYSVSNIKEGIEILTGVKAGDADPEGIYPDDTVYGKVQQQLETYFKRADKLKEKDES